MNLLSPAYLGNPHDSPIWQELSDEVDRARRKFPRPDGLMAALTEEVGELARALMDEPADRVRAEAIQVAAMALRIIDEGDPTLNDVRVRRGQEPIL